MKKNVFLVALCALSLTSCIVPQKIIYLKDMRPDLLYQITQRPDLRIQPQDRLKIVISSKEPELTAPFNMGAGGYQVGQDGEIRRTTTSSILDGGFLVDKQGNIDFPTLGTLRVEGLTKQDLAYQIRNRLREERYISDAMVTVDILNFKINVIGEVRSPGILNVVDEKITLFEAVTRAGGVTSNAEMGEIRVIREDRRGYRLFINDLRTVGVLESPTFYLQQNDIVYVLPRTATMTERENRTWQWINTVLGFGGILISVLILYNYYR